MKKIIPKIKNAWQRASSLLMPEDLLALADLLGARPALRPIPVRAEYAVYRR